MSLSQLGKNCKIPKFEEYQRDADEKIKLKLPHIIEQKAVFKFNGSSGLRTKKVSFLPENDFNHKIKRAPKLVPVLDHFMFVKESVIRKQTIPPIIVLEQKEEGDIPQIQDSQTLDISEKNSPPLETEKDVANRLEKEKEESEESLVDHAYISYSYIEAKKAHARSARNQEDRPTRLQKFLHIGTLDRNCDFSSERWGDTHSFTPAEKWKFAIETIIKLLKSFNHNSTIYDYDSYTDADTVYQLFKYHQKVSLSSKIHHYFRKKNLSEAEKARLDHLLCERIPLFSKLSYEQKVRLCQYVKYERHKKGTQLFTQGADAGYVYYILSGQIQMISKNLENAEVVVNHLSIGSTINPDNQEGSWQEHSLRLCSAYLGQDCELLSFDRRDFWHILRGEDTDNDLQERLKILQSIPTFSKEDKVILDQAVAKTSIRYIPKDSKILTQGQTNKFIYWILSGQVRVDRSTKFISRTDCRKSFRPDTSNHHIHSGEHRIDENLMIGILQKYESFPEPLPETISMGAEFDRLDLITKITDHESLGMDKSTVSVTSKTPLVCLVMHRIDFCRIMTIDMYRTLYNESSIYAIKPKPLQVEWVTKVEWGKQKKHVLKEIITGVKAQRERDKNRVLEWRNTSGDEKALEYKPLEDDNKVSSVKLDQLGPVVINSDGTISRITDWENKTEAEKENIKRVIALRNQKRMALLKEQGAVETE